MDLLPVKMSHSSRGTFRACKRKYHWSYIKGLEQQRKPKALRMGSAWSDALEFGKQALEDYYRERMMNAPEWDIDQLGFELPVISALLDTHPYAGKESREVGFEHHGPGYVDRGQLDGLEILPDGVDITENKLFARFGNMEQEKLEFDEQIDSYVAAICDGEVEGFPQGCHPSKVRVKYNVTLKPALRQRVNEPMKDYAARCVADIHARPDHYHRQFMVSRTEMQLADFRERRDKHAMDLEYEKRMGVWERSPSACFDYGQCPFLKICRSADVDEVPEGYQEKEERR